jgi:hypothetical protein
MTRETKVGLIVAGSFLCLVCVVVASKLRPGDDSEEQSVNNGVAAVSPKQNTLTPETPKKSEPAKVVEHREQDKKIDVSSPPLVVPPISATPVPKDPPLLNVDALKFPPIDAPKEAVIVPPPVEDKKAVLDLPRPNPLDQPAVTMPPPIAKPGDDKDTPRITPKDVVPAFPAMADKDKPAVPPVTFKDGPPQLPPLASD